MPRIIFTPHLEKFVPCPPAQVDGGTVREVLNAVFADNPLLRGYILDDQACVRKHIAIFVDGKLIADREKQSDAIRKSGEIYVLQALSGG